MAKQHFPSVVSLYLSLSRECVRVFDMPLVGLGVITMASQNLWHVHGVTMPL